MSNERPHGNLIAVLQGFHPVDGALSRSGVWGNG